MNKVQQIKCPCGKVFAACCEPECHTDDDWHKDKKRYIKQGCTVEMADAFKFEKCTCPNFKKPVVEKEPFVQLDIFG